MKTELKISAKPRTAVGKQASVLRRTGAIPAVIYGKNVTNINLELDLKEFQKVYSVSGESTLVELDVGRDKPRTVLVHEVQRHYLSDLPIHVDFYEVDMAKKIRAKVPIVFEGESLAVKDLGGILVKNILEVEVECLPEDLPHDLKVDISELKIFEDSVKVSEIKVDLSKVKIFAKLDEIVVKVSPPRTEEELKDLEEKPEGDDVQSVEGVVKEEKEGEAASAGSSGAPKEEKAADGKGAKAEKGEKKETAKEEKKERK